MKTLNDRFIEFYNHLISHNIVKSAKDFAESIEVSSSLITEITKGRSVVGTKAIQNSVLKYCLNSEWIFTGEGEMIIQGNNTPPSPLALILARNTSSLKDIATNKPEIKPPPPSPPPLHAEDNAMGFILDRYTELVAENTLLKKELEDLKKRLNE